MKIAFIHPSFKHHRFSENLKVVDEEFIKAPPIILAYVAAIAEKAGHEVIIIDINNTGISLDTVLNKIKEFSPDLLAFRLDTYTFREALSWIKYIKAGCNIPVLVGGINLSLYPEETMAYNEIDYGIIGEVLFSLPEFLSKLEKKEEISKISGLCYRNSNKELIINKQEEKLADFNLYPHPARHLLDNTIYHSFVSQEKNFTIMLTSTGCPYRCSFCAIAGLGHYRARSPESVINEIEECYTKYGIREIDFFDACFFADKKRVKEICRKIIEKKLKIKWTCRSRVDNVDKEILSLAKLAGLRMVFWGGESSNQDILDGVNKEITVGQTEKAISMSKKARVRNLGFLMLGSPGETAKDIRNTIRWAKKINFDYVQICRTIPKPGTQLLRETIEKTGYDYWKNYISGKTEDRRIYVDDMKLTQKQVERLLKWAYYSYYFRIRYIIKVIKKLRSIGELFRYIKVAIRMLMHFFYTDITQKKSKILKKVSHMGQLK